MVGNTPGAMSETTADLAFGLMIAVARNVVIGDQYARKPDTLFYPSELLLGMDINHQRLGLIGMGRIGKEIARRAFGFNMDIVYYCRNRLPEQVFIR